MPTIEDGVVRQVWFAPATNPSDKNSFLIRDDAYSEREATFGRTIRLGEPVDLGPFGTWRQTNWSGGHDQETWKDDAMYELATADVSERKGAVKLWNGFTEVKGIADRPTTFVAHLVAGATGLGDNVPLIMAERTLQGSPANWKSYRYIPGSGLTDIDSFTTGAIQAISLIGNPSGVTTGYMLFGFADGGIRRWDQAANTWNAVENSGIGSGSIGFRAITPFNNATYYLRGNSLCKRVNGTHTVVRAIPEISTGRGLTVWNNRMWFVGVMSQGKAGVYVSDGYTVQLAFVVPDNIECYDLCAHYGSLYIRGIVNRFGATGDVRQKVYRYNGSSLVLLHEDDNSDIDFAEAGGMCSFGRHLVWSKHGSVAMGKTAGVWMYDAEEDAIYQGPTIDMLDTHTKVTCDAVAVWNNTLVMSFTDHTVYTASTNDHPKWVAYLDRTKRPRAINLDGTTSVDGDKVKNTVLTSFSNRSFNFPQTTKTQAVLSSSFDADLAGEKKVWVKGYIRCRVPQGCQVRLALLHDDNPTEHPVKTVAYNGSVGSGWQDVQFSATCATHSVHEKSSKVRYKLYVENTNLATYPNNTAEVDVVGLDFLVSPTRRMQRHLRILARDGQQTLAGAANTLTTRDAVVAKLKEYWDAAIPVLFWGPFSNGTTPVTTGEPVDMSGWLDQSIRIASDSPEVASEVSFDILEVA